MDNNCSILNEKMNMPVIKGFWDRDTLLIRWFGDTGAAIFAMLIHYKANELRTQRNSQRHMHYFEVFCETTYVNELWLNENKEQKIGLVNVITIAEVGKGTSFHTKKER
ncbi:hypothetical protein MHH70_01810 [Metasolibacillus sp. FSL H7-0170]|uniref:hypothetical protein n=1 Tax=Metasolibacillus sp. FSL H7-0170 TaxID=2921431 RepID=UPI0031598301